MTDRLITYGIFAAVVGVLLTAIYILNIQNDYAEMERDNAIVRSVGLDARIKMIEKLRAQESEARSDYLQKLQASDDEIETLRNDLADSRKRLSIRASCPGVPKTESTGGTETASAVLDADAERTYLRLREQIAKTEAWAAMCHKTVLAWGE
jgi:prophage endopeptidase